MTVDDLDEVLLGGPRRYDRQQTCERAGVSPEWADRLWRAMGFADVADGIPVFTDEDVSALGTVARLVAAGVVNEDLTVGLTRAMAQSLSSVADWQVVGFGRQLAERPQATPAEVAADLLPPMQDLLVYIWRRQLSAAAARVGADANEAGVVVREVGVGFADLVQFTRLVHGADHDEVARLVDRFEAEAADVTARHHGRIVKTLGDEVMFVADDPAQIAEIALSVAERHDAVEELPPVRIGAAFGEVVTRFGDVFGDVVNVASRLTGLARPNTVLVDRRLGELLADSYEVRQLRPRPVPGFPRLRASVLRRTAGS
jgi:adenylate cyclase